MNLWTMIWRWLRGRCPNCETRLSDAEIVPYYTRYRCEGCGNVYNVDDVST